jgi:carbon-monoxide dehydrogenase medium subunit
MVLAPFDYAVPERLEKAVELLQQNPEARILAGGQSLLTAMKLHQIMPPLLIDLGKIADLRGIRRLSDGSIYIGAMTPLVELIEHQDLRENYAALVEIAKQAGDPQVRNVSTIGGELASDRLGTPLPTVILAFDATLFVYGPKGMRTVVASDYGVDTFQLDRADIITAIVLPPVAERSGSTYEAFKDRVSGRVICGVAVNVSVVPSGEIVHCRVAATGTFGRVVRLTEMEEALQGKQASAENIKSASRISLRKKLFSDRAASAEYRAFLVKVLSARALQRAVALANRLS